MLDTQRCGQLKNHSGSTRMAESPLPQMQTQDGPQAGLSHAVHAWGLLMNLRRGPRPVR